MSDDPHVSWAVGPQPGNRFGCETLQVNDEVRLRAGKLGTHNARPNGLILVNFSAFSAELLQLRKGKRRFFTGQRGWMLVAGCVVPATAAHSLRSLLGPFQKTPECMD